MRYRNGYSVQPIAAALLLAAAMSTAAFAQRDPDAAFLLHYRVEVPNEASAVNRMILDRHFLPFLNSRLKMTQHFWTSGAPVSQVVKEYLAVPGDVLTDGTTYFMATGCVAHFCPNKGLLWVDLTTSPATVVFAATDLMKNANSWRLYLFTSGSLQPGALPQSLRAGITRWTSQPIAGSPIEPISEAMIIDSEGMEQQVKPILLGVNEIAAHSQPIH